MTQSTLHSPMDEKLSAYLDNELTEAERDEVDTWLAAHPSDAARMRAWRQDRLALQQLFNDEALFGPRHAAPPDRLAQTVGMKPASNGPMYMMRAVAAVAVLGVGIVVGGALGPFRLERGPASAAVASAAGASSGEAWTTRAAVAHAVFVPERRHPVDVQIAGAPAAQAREQEEHLVRWLTRRVELPVKLFDLRSQGYELVGGRLLPDGSGSSAQLMYQRIDSSEADRARSRITVYLRRPESDTPAAFRYERQGELGLFYWIEGASASGGKPVGYALVGALPRGKLLELAEEIYAQETTRAR